MKKGKLRREDGNDGARKSAKNVKKQQKKRLRERKRIEEEALNIKSGFSENNDNPSFCHLNYARLAGFHFTNPNLSRPNNKLSAGTGSRLHNRGKK